MTGGAAVELREIIVPRKFETSVTLRVTLMHQDNETPLEMAEKFRLFLLQHASVVKEVEIEEQIQSREVNQHGF